MESAAEPNITNMQEVPSSFDWRKWLSTQGVGFVALFAFAGWFGYDIVIPMRDDQREFSRSVVKANEIAATANLSNAEANKANAEANRQSAATHQKLSEVQQSQAAALTQIPLLLKEIRDDQRRGAWKENP